MAHVTAPAGALEAFVDARKQGLIRHIGFSAHSVEIALQMMDVFPFDSVLFPINWVGYFEAGFGPQVVARAEGKGIARLALKGMAKHRLAPGEARTRERCWYAPAEKHELADLALRFTLSQPITAAIPPGDPDLFRMALDIAESFRPITDEELGRLRERARGMRPLFELAG